MDRRVLGSVTKGAMYALASYGHFVEQCWNFFHGFFLFYIYIFARKILKINPGVCRLHWEFNFGSPCVWWHSSLRHCATSRKVVGSIPSGVTGIFH
jgi:hypothetical protein